MDALIETDLEGVNMKLLFVFIVLASIPGVIIITQGLQADRDYQKKERLKTTMDWVEEERRRIFEFRSVHPDSLPEETYIWTPREVYQVGEKIPLYIEEVAVRGEFSYNVFSVAWHAPSTLKIKRGNYLLSHNRGRGCGPFPDGPCSPEKSRSDYIPPIEEIDLSRLHGRLVFPVRDPGPLSMPDLVKCKIGECVVLRLIDLTATWKIKRAPDGRTLVQFVKWNSHKPGFDVLWLDIRGVYKIQWANSNIIEFEIR